MRTTEQGDSYDNDHAFHIQQDVRIVRKVLVVKGEDFDMKTEKMSVAEHVSAALGGDGSRWETEDGTSIYNLMNEFGGWLQEIGEGDYWGMFRYVFRDGSAIVECDAGWDIEGKTPFWLIVSRIVSVSRSESDGY